LRNRLPEQARVRASGTHSPLINTWPSRMLLKRTSALIVIDVQNDFVSGSMAVANARRIINPINRLAETFETVVVAQDWHPPGHVSFASAHAEARPRDVVTVSYGVQRVFCDHCIQGTEGAELYPALRLEKAALILRKGYRREIDSYSAFYENDGKTCTGLAAYLRARGFDAVICVGLTRYGCVMASATDAVRDGFRVAIVDDACEDGDLDASAIATADRKLAELGVARLKSELTIAAGATDSLH
jgi:nicotinamidase/pyrazinamidase